MIDQHLKETARNLQRLHQGTPRSVVFFLGGCLPGTAEIHLRQFSLFGMISRSSDSLLFDLATTYFNSSSPSKKSWFNQILSLCHLYCLPHPSVLLSCPLMKDKYKRLVKSKVISYWENVLRLEASSLRSLQYFNPYYMSLSSSHPIWFTARSSPSKVTMATVQAQMLSGRFCTQKLCSLWSPHN